MAPLPTLALARLIASSYLKDDFLLVIIYGNLRMGKSAYAMKVMGQVYDYLRGRPLSIDLIDEYLAWHPTEVIEKWSSITKRIPMFIWDDAGYWLFTMNWHDPLMIEIQKYFNVVGTDMNTLVLTTPDPTWILGKLLNMPGTIRVKVIKRDGGVGDSKTRLYAREARGYKPYRSPDLKKTGVNRILTDQFSCYIPDDIYAFYQPRREHYTRLAKRKMRDVMLAKMKLDGGVEESQIDERIKVAVDSVKRRKGDE